MSLCFFLEAVDGAGANFMLSGQPPACVGINLNGAWLVKGNTTSGRPWYTHKIAAWQKLIQKMEKMKVSEISPMKSKTEAQLSKLGLGYTERSTVRSCIPTCSSSTGSIPGFDGGAAGNRQGPGCLYTHKTSCRQRLNDTCIFFQSLFSPSFYHLANAPSLISRSKNLTREASAFAGRG